MRSRMSGVAIRLGLALLVAALVIGAVTGKAGLAVALIVAGVILVITGLVWQRGVRGG